MNTQEITKKVAELTGNSFKATREVVDALVQVVGKEVRSGNRVCLKGLGIFFTKQSPARMARNPKTNTPVKVPAKRVARFRPGKALREAAAKK